MADAPSRPADRFFANKVIQTASGGYASYDCACKADTCPAMHNNQIFTPDGKMGQICGQSRSKTYIGRGNQLGG